MKPYRYTESGLDDVFIHGARFQTDDAGEETITIPNIADLHKLIATMLVEKTSSLTGRELRFLRTEMGMTQAELAQLVHREPLAISRWERGEVAEIDSNAEALIRLHACEALCLDIKASVKQISGFSIPRASSPPIDIECSNDNEYRPMRMSA
ncbi:MAG: helix-turn-helix domain-containing protein [Beijerinckiaceae bacterium]